MVEGVPRHSHAVPAVPLPQPARLCPALHERGVPGGAGGHTLPLPRHLRVQQRGQLSCRGVQGEK